MGSVRWDAGRAGGLAVPAAERSRGETAQLIPPCLLSMVLPQLGFQMALPNLLSSTQKFPKGWALSSASAHFTSAN